jgi:hypothetical protein
MSRGRESVVTFDDVEETSLSDEPGRGESTEITDVVVERGAWLVLLFILWWLL